MEDNERGTKGGPDRFDIVVRDDKGTVVFSAAGPLNGGKITIH